MDPLRALVVISGLLFAGPPALVRGQAEAGAGAADPISLIIRTDDIGMSHSVNMAMQTLIASGLPLSVSVMFACPWFQEAVEILKQHPQVSVGIHLTLNSEWRYYRWGPVTGREAVPTLVDAEGYFFQSADALYQNNPDLGEIERELRAQLERARRSGLTIDYLDYHMGTAGRDPDVRSLTERLAREYGFGISGYFGERMDSPQYWAPPGKKSDSLVAMINRLEPGLNVVVTHVGLDDAELGALLDMNTANPLPDMSQNRQGELDALRSKKFRNALKTRNIQLMTYRELIAREGLSAMHRPPG